MPIYFGNNKIGKIYVGSTEIGKVYHGSTLVYENRKKLPIYGYSKNSDGTGVSCFLLGSNSTDGAIVDDNLTTLKTITGTLGTAGSKITVEGDSSASSTDEFTYDRTLTYNGVKVYMYVITNTSVRVCFAQYVIEDARIGSKCLAYGGYVFLNNEIYYTPSSVASDRYVYFNQITYYRKAASDTNYTRDGYTN